MTPRENAAHRRRRRNHRVMMMMGAITIVLLAALVYVIMLAASSQPPASVATNQTSAPNQITDNTTDASIPVETAREITFDNLLTDKPLVQPFALSPSSWQMIREPWETPVDKLAVQIIDQQVLSVDANQTLLQLTLATRSFEMYESCTVTLYLVDQQYTAYAAATLPIAMLSAGNTVTVAIPIDNVLYDRMHELRWREELGRKITHAGFFESVEYDFRTQDNALAMQVRMTNDSGRSVERCVIVIQVYDAQDVSRSMWRVDRSVDLAPDASDAFAVKLLPVDHVQRVQVLALGVYDQDQPPSSESATDAIFSD